MLPNFPAPQPSLSPDRHNPVPYPSAPLLLREWSSSASRERGSESGPRRHFRRKTGNQAPSSRDNDEDHAILSGTCSFSFPVLGAVLLVYNSHPPRTGLGYLGACWNGRVCSQSRPRECIIEVGGGEVDGTPFLFFLFFLLQGQVLKRRSSPSPLWGPGRGPGCVRHVGEGKGRRLALRD